MGGGGWWTRCKHQAPSSKRQRNPKSQTPTPKKNSNSQLPNRMAAAWSWVLGFEAAWRQRIAEMGDRQYEREERFHRARRWRHGDQGTGVWAGGGKTGRGNGGDGGGWHEGVGLWRA